MCLHPLLAACVGLKDNGAKNIKFLAGVQWSVSKAESMYGKENVFLIPCGSCIDCNKAYKSSWAARCLAELQYFDKSCFVTLTYDEVHLPKDSKLEVSDLQKFFKRLRSKGFNFRYFACGEKGERFGRPHFHIIFFGFEPGDLVPFFKNKLGQTTFKSDLLTSVWSCGQVLVGEVSEQSIKYVAGYTGKKIGHTGFVVMSRRPGIGFQYVVDNAIDILKTGSCVLKNGIVPAPSYFIDVLQNLGYDISYLKELRVKLLDDKCRSYLIENKIDIKDYFYLKNQHKKVIQRKRGF